MICKKTLVSLVLKHQREEKGEKLQERQLEGFLRYRQTQNPVKRFQLRL